MMFAIVLMEVSVSNDALNAGHRPLINVSRKLLVPTGNLA